MARNRLGLAVVITCLLAAGCAQRSAPPSPQPAQQPSPGNAGHQDYKTPDLAGGRESENREDRHRPASQDQTATNTILFYSGPRSAKQVALTFDDGPDVHFTPQILDILKRNGIKATFFIVGTRAQAHPEMVKRIAAEGHVIGNHTWDHPKLTKLPPDQIRSEIDRTNQLLHSIVGYYPAIFRPPYGLASPDIVREAGSLGYKVIDWSVDTRDWAGTPAPQIMNFVRTETRPGGIILQHCAGGRRENLSNTVSALPEIISTLKSQGYTFTTVPELVHIPATKAR